MPLEPRARVDAFLHWTDDVADQAEPLDPSLHPVAVGAVLNLMIDVAGMAAPALSTYWDADDSTELIDAVSYVFDRVLGVGSDDA